MDTDDETFTVDDIVTGKVAESLGQGLIPTSAILIVETVSEGGRGLQFMRSEGVPTWLALGMLRSTVLRVEEQDVDSWVDDDEEP